MDWLANLFSFLGNRSFGRTSWARWIGSVLVLAIVGVWAFLSIKNSQFIAMDSANTSIVIFILLLNGLKLNTPEK